MNKFFSFAAGALTGALAGAVLALLLTPASGEEIKTQAVTRWETALNEARLAMEQTRAEMEAQFEQMKKG
ncbi:MAG: hypothetical protein Kow0080_16520 [Candidatus Promineifilaceae bacterium]